MLFYVQRQLSELKNQILFDVNGHKIGKIRDILLTEDYVVHSILVRPSSFDSVKTLRKVDSFKIPIDYVIKEVKEGFKININSNQLEALPEGFSENRFSTYKNNKVYDKDHILVGRVIDCIVHVDGRISFILGGSYLEEFNERIGVIPDLDLFLPIPLIDRIEDEEIILSVSHTQLAQKATRKDIKRGVNFNRYPGIPQYVFFRMETSLSELLDRREKLSQTIKNSRAASEIVIREYDPATDLEVLVDLYNRIFMASPDPVRELNIDEAGYFEAENTFIATLASKPVGFIYLPIEDHGDFKVGAIAGIGVSGTHRGRKISISLVKHAIDYFVTHNVNKVVAEVYEMNEPSRSLFQSLGFTVQGYMILEHE